MATFASHGTDTRAFSANYISRMAFALVSDIWICYSEIVSKFHWQHLSSYIDRITKTYEPPDREDP